MLNKLFLVLLLSWLYSGALIAQPYIIQPGGYSADPKFHTLIKLRKYTLVGRFDTVSKDPAILQAPILKAGRWIAIDQNGKEGPLSDQEPDHIIRGAPYEGGIDTDKINVLLHGEYEVFQEAGNFGIRNRSTKSEIIPARYEKAQISKFGFFPVMKNKKWGIVDKNGNEILPFIYDEIRSLARHMASNKIVGKADIVRSGNLWGLLSPTGTLVSEPKYDDIENSWVISSVLFAKKGSKWAILNARGDELSPFKYDHHDDVDPNGIVLVKTGGNFAKSGLVDTLGNEILPPIFDRVEYFGNGLYLVANGSKQSLQYGLYDKFGKELIPPSYSLIQKFSYGWISLIQPDKYGWADKNGKIIAEPIYQSLQIIDREKTIVKHNNKYGVMTAAGEILIPIVHDHLSLVNNELLQIIREGRYGAINFKGDIIFPAVYERKFESERPGIYSTFQNGGLINIDLYGNKISVPTR